MSFPSYLNYDEKSPVKSPPVLIYFPCIAKEVGPAPSNNFCCSAMSNSFEYIKNIWWEKNDRVVQSSANITRPNTTWYCLQYFSYLHRNLYTQQTPHTSPSRASYEVSIVRNLEKIARVITAPHSIHVCCDSMHCFAAYLPKSDGGKLSMSITFMILIIQNVHTASMILNTQFECANVLTRFHCKQEWPILFRS